MATETTRSTAATLSTTVIIAVAAGISISFVSASFFRRKLRLLSSRVVELEDSLAVETEKCASERRGRIKAQQALRKALVHQSLDDGSKMASNLGAYPMAPIGVVRSCFSTRNGTPRQPLLVPLARACLELDPARVPAEALEGLTGYSHCWVLYVFHLNTDLDKLWKEPSRSKFKAKVRVPRLKGGKVGALATRSPHRPCPIGLSVAKVEAVDGQAILLSGVDLVDGTPVLDIKPYLPYSDVVQGATVPQWLKADNALAVASVQFSTDFSSSLASCWKKAGKQSLYSCESEFQSLVMEVLSWDIRSISQRNHPHNVMADYECQDALGKLETGEDLHQSLDKNRTSLPSEVVYHLALEGIDITYRIDDDSHILVEKATTIDCSARDNCRYNYSTFKDKFKNLNQCCDIK